MKYTFVAVAMVPAYFEIEAESAQEAFDIAMESPYSEWSISNQEIIEINAMKYCE